MSKLLTIGMATYDDYDGVYFTVQSLRLYHDILKDIDYEIIIVDNNPEGRYSESIKDLVKWSNGLCRYIPYKTIRSTSVRNEVFQQASGKYTLCLDCHVMVMNGGIQSLLKYYNLNQDCKDIIQGPMLYDDLYNLATDFAPVWRGDMYGIWNANNEKLATDQPFEILMMGLGLFSCETKNWRKFNTNFKGFGGEEGYIHEKFRQNGGKAICIPQLKWLHRFNRPFGVNYPLILEDRIWNYFVGWLELTQDPDHNMIQDIYNYFITRIPQHSLDHILNNAKNLILGDKHANSI